jgi:HAD superfamily hydrolase (TIGR01484 family)
MTAMEARAMRYTALATDYDGTLAQDGHVEPETIGALERVRASGRKVILVTGRELPELRSVWPRFDACDAIVAENGGLIYWPAEDREEVLGEPPPEAFVTEMVRRQVTPYSLGKVVFATWRPHEVAVLEAIQKLGIEYQIIFNKRAVMVLPSLVNKATGLTAALKRLGLQSQQVVGIGDAENDHAFLDVCCVSAVVSNAVPALKGKCDLVTLGDHGRGVIELIDRLLEDDLASLGPRAPRAKLAVHTIEE